jgi:glycerol-3-phosphate acyltransferase PlsX
LTAVTVALDVMGGDRAPAETVAGACRAAEPGVLDVLLVGDERAIRHALGGAPPPGLAVEHAPEAIGDGDGPEAVRSRPHSSLARALGAVREGRAAACVSMGPTGAVVAAALLALRRLPGVLRPALAATLPADGGPVLLIDAGANADPRPEQLVQFAQMGTLVAEDLLRIPEATCGLLSIGEEAGKGSQVVREANVLLAAAPGVRFRGNVEGHDLLTRAVDVVVTDGFTGNVVLKTAEGTAQHALRRLRATALGSARGRAGGLLLRPTVRALRAEMHPDTYGGAWLVGLDALVVIGHGSSSRTGVANACRYAADAVRRDVPARLAARMAAR